MNPEYEQMGLFYLGKLKQPEVRTGRPLLLPSADLRTHALCVGMTGSGKTGLCIDLLEEAAIDGIPALVVDPKGDITNLCLQFPHMSPEEFSPWIDQYSGEGGSAAPEERARQLADQWREGLAAFDQTPERIRHLRERSDITLYTPGSTAGEPVSILQLMAPPAMDLLSDRELVTTQALNLAESLLTLVGIATGESPTRESTFLSNLILDGWNKGKSIQLGELITSIQTPPFQTIGVMDIEAFFPEKERQNLALKLNNLLASPTFGSWLSGAPLNIDQLLYSETGRPRVAILSIAHLSESERQFFVSALLNQLIFWMRQQKGSQSLRALFYMDEIYGYFPPVAVPPTKKPLMTLLKQARAYGLGLVLATQNPVDIDYKGLSNMGIWLVGRLQTENDRNRLLDGLQIMGNEGGHAFSRQKMADLIGGLGKREFLLSSIYEEESCVFESRWALSYLKGPLTREEIRLIREKGYSDPHGHYPQTVSAGMEGRVAASPAGSQWSQQEEYGERTQSPFTTSNFDPDQNRGHEPVSRVDDTVLQQDRQFSSGSDPVAKHNSRPEIVLPALPAGISSVYRPAEDGQTHYEAKLGAVVEVLFVDQQGRETHQQKVVVTPLTNTALGADWEAGRELSLKPEELQVKPSIPLPYGVIPAAAREKSAYTQWKKDLQDWVYRTDRLVRYENPYFKMQSFEGESERDFRIRMEGEARERREAEWEKLRQTYQRKISQLEEKVHRAEQAVEREKVQAADAKRQATLSFGATLLDAVLGRGRSLRTTVSKGMTASKSASRASRAQSDVGRAQETVELAGGQLEDLRSEMEEALLNLKQEYQQRVQAVEPVEIKPLKKNINVRFFGIIWGPEE